MSLKNKNVRQVRELHPLVYHRFVRQRQTFENKVMMSFKTFLNFNKTSDASHRIN